MQYYKSLHLCKKVKLLLVFAQIRYRLIFVVATNDDKNDIEFNFTLDLIKSAFAFVENTQELFKMMRRKFIYDLNNILF